MSLTDASFEAIQQALRGVFTNVDSGKFGLQRQERMLLLRLPADIAAFTVCNGRTNEEFSEAYGDFKLLYREHHQEWDRLTLSFVVCRAAERLEDERFYASLEHDSLFCRKYVIRAFDDANQQRTELLRLPFLPLPSSGQGGLQRPQSAQDLLQSSGISASLARSLIEAGRAPHTIAQDLLEGADSFPSKIGKPVGNRVLLAKPRAYSRLESATLDGFRVYQTSQHFNLDAPVVVLYGPNGLGKTSFFDAIEFGCTGRIERLCRHQKRSQADFSRIATHLDRIPGTGSVAIVGRSEHTDQTSAKWTLKRATGDWSAAWINGEESTRKEVLSFLTHANWPESQPRQQTFESLFRATHLFGQDEQELLINFRKRSVIPEEFISEMLALQDYSQGLKKVAGVLTELKSLRTDIEENRDALLNQQTALIDSLALLTSTNSESADLPGIDEYIESIKTLLAPVTTFAIAQPGNLTAQSAQEWLDFVSANLATIESRISIATSLRDDLPKYRRAAEDVASLTTQRATLQQIIEGLEKEEVGLRAQIESDVTALAEAEARQRRLENSCAELRSVTDNLTQISHLTHLMTVLNTEQQQQHAARADIERRLATANATLLQAQDTYSAILQQINKLKETIANLDGLIARIPQFESDVSAFAQAQVEESAATDALREAQRLRDESESRAFDAQLMRESVRPEYERALTAQEEIDRLLDGIQALVRTSSCPLCGTDFVSQESLLDHIEQQRQNLKYDRDISLRYAGLVTAESHAADQLRVASAGLENAGRSLQSSAKRRERLESEVAVYRELVATTLNDRTVVPTKVRFFELRQNAEEELSLFERSADFASRELSELELAISTDEDALRSINERIVQSIDEHQRLDNERRQHDTITKSVLENVGVSASDVASSIDQLGFAIEKLVKEIAETNRIRSERRVKLDERSARLNAERIQLDTVQLELEKHRRFVRETEKRSEDLGLIGGASDVVLEHSTDQFERQAAILRFSLEQIHVVVATLHAREVRQQIEEKQKAIQSLKERIEQFNRRIVVLAQASAGCSSVEKLLQTERQTAVEQHISTYGPLITNIQQRLRSVYGFGGVHLEARGGEAAVQVEWRNKSVQVPPTDVFSDSQKQILMLSIFLAGGLRQNWSGFAPVLLDDPVTHFDDLNAYGFVELVRGIIASQPTAWQFFISTCEDRLFSLMQKKFAHLSGGAIFYEFLGMGHNGPIVEQR